MSKLGIPGQKLRCSRDRTESEDIGTNEMTGKLSKPI